MKPEMTPLVLASLLLGAFALPSSPSSSINEQRSENYKSNGNPKSTSSSSSNSKVYPRRVFGAYKRTHTTNENNSSINSLMTDNSAYINRNKTSTNGSSHGTSDMFLEEINSNSKGKKNQTKFGKVGYTKTTPQAKQITYHPYHQHAPHYIQKNMNPTVSSIDINSDEITGNVVLPRADSGKLKDSYLQEIPISMVYSGHSNSLDDLQDSYLQGSSASMLHTVQPNSLDDLQDSYLQGSTATMVHTAQTNSLDDLQDNYLSSQSNSFDGSHNSYLIGSSTGMGHSAQPSSIGDLQDSYLQGSSSGTVNYGHSGSLNDIQDSYLQGGSAEASSLYDVKDNYLNGSSVAKTPTVNSNSYTLQDSYLQGSNTLDVPLVHSNSYDGLENNYLQGSNAVDVPLRQSNDFGGVHEQDSYFQGDSAADSFVEGGLGLGSEAQGVVSDALQMDSEPYNSNLQHNHTALPPPSENQSFSLSPMPPVPIYYQTPPPLPMLSSTYNNIQPSPQQFTSAPYEYLIPPPTSHSPPSMSSESYVTPAALPQPILETSISYDYHPPSPPTIPTTVTSVPYDYQPPRKAPVAYDSVPSPPRLTAVPYYYSPPPVPPSPQYLPAPTTPPTTPIPTVEFVPYNVGAKIWFIPLVFSAYFAVYITALILKSIIRHKYFFPTNLLVAATETGRDHGTNLDHLSKIVTKAIATALINSIDVSRHRSYRSYGYSENRFSANSPFFSNVASNGNSDYGSSYFNNGYSATTNVGHDTNSLAYGKRSYTSGMNSNNKILDYGQTHAQGEQVAGLPTYSISLDRFHPTTFNGDANEHTGEVQLSADNTNLLGNFQQDISAASSNFDSDLAAQGSDAGGSQVDLQAPDNTAVEHNYDYTAPALPTGYDYHPPAPVAPYYYPTPPPASIQYLPVPTLPPPPPPPTTTPPPTQVYTSYNLGPKIWYIPMVFCAYFSVYVIAVIIKAWTKHKVLFPQSVYAAASYTGRHDTSAFHQLAINVVKEITDAAKKYIIENNTLSRP